ncbi:Hypothetical predicted protein [Cloeon dipterum]|uniref:Odorant receptor n=1 Tax=Cloeon dipterum TaxID=197152 RepID=A0A8S1DI28_9INSE|nr:Hypothetical predicted protein [Cloeon dipterum]
MKHLTMRKAENGQMLSEERRPRAAVGQLGPWLLYILHMLCGQHLRLPGAGGEFGGVRRVLMCLHAATISLATVYCTLSGSYALSKHLDNFGHSLYIATGFLGMAECLVRILYTVLRKSTIEHIAGKLHHALHQAQIDPEPEHFVRRTSKVTAVFLVTLFSSFGVAICSSYMTIFAQIGTLIDSYMQNGTQAEDADLLLTKSEEVSIEILEAWYYVQRFFKMWPYVALVKAYAAFVYAVSFLSLGRVVVSDILFYSWYATLNHLYRVLVDALPQALAADAAADRKKALADWIQHHHSLNQLLKEINSLTSPVIVIAVVLTGFRICILYFVLFKLADPTSIFLIMVYGLSSVQQVFVYSILGQRIKNNVTHLHAQAYKSAWVESDGTVQHATLMICTAASDKIGQSLPGAPFFSMSLEFMASMLSVVFTYFVVLFQLQ